MKKNCVFLIIATTLFISCSYSQSNPSGEETVKMLKEFYTSYITETSKAPGNAKNIEAIKRKYCTSKLLDKIEKDELDYDPILNAQDCDIQWLETLSIVKDTKQVNTYIVSYTDNFSKENKSIRLVVINKKGNPMIDSIL